MFLECIVNPLGRVSFQKLQCLRNRKCGRNREKNVHVIFYATDHQCLHSVFSRNTPKIWPETCLKLWPNQRTTLFGRKYAVYQTTDKRVHKANDLKTAKK